MKQYKLTLYAVQTYGGQIINDQQPRPVDIVCDSAEQKKEIQQKAKRHALSDEYARYYATEQDANDAIIWALCN